MTISATSRTIAAAMALFLSSAPTVRAETDRPLTQGHPFGLGRGTSTTLAANVPPTTFSSTSLKDVLAQITKAQGNIVGQLQTINALANQPFPNSAATASQVWDPYAAACMPPLINFIETVPAPDVIPNSTVGGGHGAACHPI